MTGLCTKLENQNKKFSLEGIKPLNAIEIHFLFQFFFEFPHAP